ncbi:hypothetical protein M9H77_22102 [Catharanthus roseus]|uniref:Uncharacterized protein n=1 Tax=Catharanthus roseus TaxID=4058 RepID=A0ACC0AQF4_CATRO|nr:hypothetical protein M9H77_00498 [Catharanthus roseus]KAI5662779.1 hypothetical protein M9H77_22102 [Catharanthus roseus]
MMIFEVLIAESRLIHRESSGKKTFSYAGSARILIATLSNRDSVEVLKCFQCSNDLKSAEFSYSIYLSPFSKKEMVSAYNTQQVIETEPLARYLHIWSSACLGFLAKLRWSVFRKSNHHALKPF